MTGAISAVLSEVAGTRMYARNAFRLVELPTNATRRQILERKQRITTMRQVDPELVSQDVVGAFDRLLGDPRRRLVDEIFWFWDVETMDCGCSGSLHKDHDKAVRAHFEVLQRENRGNIVRETNQELQRTMTMWSATAELWGKVLRRAALWDHVRHRIAALDDRQLDESVIDVLRDEVPTVLVKPLIQFAGDAENGQQQRAEVARQWPVPSRVVDDLLESVVAPAYEMVDDVTSEAHRLVEAGDTDAAVQRMAELVPTLRRMNALTPSDRHRRTATARNSVASVYNNCALTLVKRDGVVSPARATGDGWLDEARKFATSPQTIETIEQNRRAIEETYAEVMNIQRRVETLVHRGQQNEAVLILTTLRSQLDGDLGSVDLEAMLRRLGVPAAGAGRSTTPRYPSDASYPSYQRPGWQPPRSNRKLVVAVVIALLMLVGWLLLRSGSEGSARTMPTPWSVGIVHGGMT